jgi:serine phosphatase RsbU (regulator of sigma subunit)
MTISVGLAARPKPGETECGDRVVVVESDASVLVAVVDGLGHGPEAALAAKAAEAFVRANATLPLPELFNGCHRALAGTRGVAMAVLRIDVARSTLTHSAVGNVELHALSREPVRAISEPGIVGSRFRRPRESSYPLSPGDLFVLFSDGVSSRLDLEPYKAMTTRAVTPALGDFSAYRRVLSAQDIAKAVIRDHGKAHDDASCAVVAY